MNTERRIPTGRLPHVRISPDRARLQSRCSRRSQVCAPTPPTTSGSPRAMLHGPVAEQIRHSPRNLLSHEEANPPVMIVEPASALGQHPASAGTIHSTPSVHVAALAGRSLTATASGAVKVKLRCLAADARCTGTLTLRTLTAVITGIGHHPRRSKAILTLARGSFTAAGERTTTVTLHLFARARSLLAGARLLPARATIAAHESQGVTRITKAIVTIRSAPPHRAS